MKQSLTKPFLCGAFGLSLASLLVACQSVPTQTAIGLSHLQGYWEGEGAGGKCSITITGNTLHYRAGTNWHKTTFTLPAGTNPQQLHATIKETWPPSKDAIGQEVHAIIKIEDGVLTLSAYDMSQEPPKTFDDPNNRYVVKRAQPRKEDPSYPKTKEPVVADPLNLRLWTLETVSPNPPPK